MAEIIPTPQTIPASEPKYPEIEELKLDTNYLSSGKLSDLTQALGINMPSTGIKTRATADEVLFSIGTKLNNLTNQIEESKARKESAALDTKQKYYDDINEKEAKATNESKDKLKKLTEAGLEKFAPTQENVPQLAALFSTIGILGAIIGGGGRNSAMNALSSMTGMLEGYKKGQIDRFKQEKVMFDAHLAQLKVERENIIQEMKQIADEYVRDREKGKEKFENFMAKLNSQVLKDINKVSGIQGVMKALFTSTYDGIKNMESLNNQLTMESVKFQHQKELKQIEKNSGKSLKEKELNDLQGLNSLAGTLDELKKTFKPEYASLGVLGVGTDISLEAKRRGFGDEDAQNAARWWANYQRLQAPNRHALFGSTLTGNELKNYQSFTAKPSDDFQYVVNSLTDQINYAKSAESSKRNNLEAAGYRIPEKLPKVNFIETYSETPSTPSSQIPTIKSQEEFNDLPSGSLYYEDDGKPYRKP